jgi:hypothetical protein
MKYGSVSAQARTTWSYQCITGLAKTSTTACGSLLLTCVPLPPLLPRLPLQQLKRLKLVVANGTTLVLSLKSNPHLFMAAGVNVGRLGIVTEVTLKIKAQQAVQRKLQVSSVSPAWEVSAAKPYRL